jgi:hypothetical protein
MQESLYSKPPKPTREGGRGEIGKILQLKENGLMEANLARERPTLFAFLLTQQNLQLLNDLRKPRISLQVELINQKPKEDVPLR